MGKNKNCTEHEVFAKLKYIPVRSRVCMCVSLRNRFVAQRKHDLFYTKTYNIYACVPRQGGKFDPVHKPRLQVLVRVIETYIYNIYMYARG